MTEPKLVGTEFRNLIEIKLPLFQYRMVGDNGSAVLNCRVNIVERGQSEVYNKSLTYKSNL